MNKRRLKKLIKKSKIINICCETDYEEHINGNDISFHKYGFDVGEYVYYPYTWIRRVICG